MALVGIEGLGLNEVVSEDTDKETNKTVIDITNVEIVSDTTSDISNFSNEITDTVIDLSNIKTNNGELIEYEPSNNNKDKITKIDIDAYNQMPNFELLGVYTFEEMYKMYIEYVNEKCISIVDKNTVNENSNSCIIKLNSEENDLWYDRNTYDLDDKISRKKIFNNKTFIYLKNVINNLFIDYYNILHNNNIRTFYINFDEEFNDEEIKVFIINFIIGIKYLDAFYIKKR